MGEALPRGRSIRGRAASIDVVTPPTAEPVDLATARLHLRLDAAGSPATHPDDALVSLWTAAARAECESYTNRRFMTQTLKIGLAVGGAGVELPVAPVQSISSVETVAADGSTALVPPADYVPVLAVVPSRILPASAGAAWASAGAVSVTAVVGYASADEVPPPIKAAILLLLGQAYELREAGDETTWGDAMPVTVARLLAPYRVWLF